VTSLLVGFIVRPTLGEALVPVAEAVGLPADVTEGVAVGTALVFATAVQMVLGELIPKNLAVAEPLRVSSALATPLRLVNTALKPIIVALNATANATVRLLGIEPRDELESIVSLEELETLIKSSRRSGLLPEEDYSLLARSITFADKTAADALVPRTKVIAIANDATLHDLAQLALETGHSRFPVQAQNIDEIEGVVNVKSIYDVSIPERGSTVVASIATDVPVVPESRPLDSVLTQMRRDRAHLVIVLDEYGGTAGILTLEDVVEEIVGEIEDEHDPSEASTREVPQGVFVLGGLLHPEETLQACGFEMPEGDFETLGGFLLESFGRVPSTGDQLAHEGWEFKVTKMDGRRIAEVLAVAPTSEGIPR
jgi:CBS domain containing-hemolysin-like protein